MGSSDEENFREIFDRLRETEAQTREQNARIASLCDRLDNFTVVTDKFFELEDKRHQADEKRFETLCEHEKRLSDDAENRYKQLIESMDQREQKFWKAISILIGAVLVLSMGPKAVKGIWDATHGGDAKIPVASCISSPIFPPNDNSVKVVNSSGEEFSV